MRVTFACLPMNGGAPDRLPVLAGLEIRPVFWETTYPLSSARTAPEGASPPVHILRRTLAAIWRGWTGNAVYVLTAPPDSATGWGFSAWGPLSSPALPVSGRGS
jgi:hypothetical protein